MTDREVEKVLVGRGMAEYCRTCELGRVLGISYNSVKKALDEGKLPRAARGFVTRPAVAIWLSSREDLIAQMMSGDRGHTDRNGRTRTNTDAAVIVPWWTDACFTVTVR